MKVSKKLGTIDSSLLCEYILQKKEPMSHVKLQKLLYYIEALHLANFECPLVDDEFEAWVHGPVSRKIYTKFKGSSLFYAEIIASRKINPKPIMERDLTNEQINLIDEVITVYSNFTALQLENLSHSEKPWIEARIGLTDADRCTKKISKTTMKEFYKNMLYG